jgi:hypothetical protein
MKKSERCQEVSTDNHSSIALVELSCPKDGRYAACGGHWRHTDQSNGAYGYEAMQWIDE